jgi:hypothetical protein
MGDLATACAPYIEQALRFHDDTAGRLIIAVLVAAFCFWLGRKSAKQTAGPDDEYLKQLHQQAERGELGPAVKQAAERGEVRKFLQQVRDIGGR